MAPDDPLDERQADAELAEQEERKEDEVLEREGVEQDLMQKGRSEVGEAVEDVEDE